MRYEAVTLGDGSRFEFEREEPLKEGDTFIQLTVIYKVRHVQPDNDDFDAILQVEQVGGPAEAWYG